MKHIRAILVSALALCLIATGAIAQSSPNWPYGFVPSAAQWNAAFASKQDYLGYRPLNPGGDTMTGRLVIAPSTTTQAGIRFGVGVAPTTPSDGDFWITSSNAFARIGGVTNIFVTVPGCEGALSYSVTYGVSCVTLGYFATGTDASYLTTASTPAALPATTGQTWNNGGMLSVSQALGGSPPSAAPSTSDYPSITLNALRVNTLPTFATCSGIVTGNLTSPATCTAPGTGVMTALGNAVDASGGLTSYTTFSSVIPHPSTNVQSTGMPGINGGHWFIYNNAASAFDTLPTFRVDRRTPTGTGTSGNTYKAIWAYVTTNANNVGYEWAITGEVINTAHGGQNVAVNGTITKTPNGVSTIGPSWGGNFVCHDTTTETDPTASCIGAELDVYADTAGTDANKQRVGLQIVAGNTSGVHVGRGLFMTTRTGVTIDRGFDVHGTYGIGFDTTAATFTGAAYLLASSQKIALDGATGGTYSRYISYNGTSLTYTTSSGSYWSVSDTGDVSAPSVTSLNPTVKWSSSNWGTQFLAKSSGGSSNPAIGLSNSSGSSWVALGNTSGTLAFMSMSGNPGDTSFATSYMLKMTTANAQFYGSVQPATVTIAGLSTCSSTLKGARYEVSNGDGAGTWGSTVSATGSAQMPVRCNGTNWVYGG